MGRMFMVDLAGSERLKKSKSVGLRAQEAKAINLSLTTLGMCVNAKSDPNATHIPFRDSKLTRLLQESLGGNAKTSMLIAVSDAREHTDETFQSLLFGSRAILVKTAPRVNQYFDLSALNERIAQSLQARPPRPAVGVVSERCLRWLCTRAAVAGLPQYSISTTASDNAWMLPGFETSGVSVHADGTAKRSVNVQEEKPETALERALVDREETVSRLERELERERLQGKSTTSTLQRRLDEALQQGQSATREHETSRMALAAANMAHEQQMREADKRQTALRHELSSTQV